MDARLYALLERCKRHGSAGAAGPLTLDINFTCGKGRRCAMEYSLPNNGLDSCPL
jgi:hypothetical protein